MRLRKQLLLLSLVTLALPWVGCQYIQEVDGMLRQGQTESLVATSRAVAARISSDKQLSQSISNLLEPEGSLASALYAHPQKTALWLDGFNDDWIERGMPFSDQYSPQRPTLAVYQQQLYVFLKVDTDQLQYFNPANSTLDQSDHILLYTSKGKYALFASAPGQLRAIKYSEEKTVSAASLEHQIKGYWLESSNGYQLEFTFPLAWTKQGIAFNTHEAEASLINKVSSVSSANQEPFNEFRLFPLITHLTTLNRELAVFSSSHLRLHLVLNNGQRIASSGNLSMKIPQQKQQHGFIEWLYESTIAEQNYTLLPNTNTQGIYTAPAIQNALQENLISQQWYSSRSQAVAQVVFPISSSGSSSESTPLGAIIAEQSASSLASVTNSAFSRLLGYSLLIILLAGVALMIYATWLSLRIRRLSHAAANAIDDSGKISESFPTSKSNDELGELSRNYAQLLARLREYTHYLRTLSSKLSHELRTPLAIVRSSLDNLEHEPLDEQANVYAERAREGTNRLSAILNAMGAATRVEQAIESAEIEQIPCNELMLHVSQAYQSIYPHVDIRLVITPEASSNVSTDEPFIIEGSGELLVQALDKLVDNAADFCPTQGIIELRLSRTEDTIILSVFNEGPALPEHMSHQLFDSMVSVRDNHSQPHSQTHSQTRLQTSSQEPSQQNGSNTHHLGLGLYIVRLITDFHNGQVRGYNVKLGESIQNDGNRSVEHSGVIFEMTLPRVK